MRPSVRALCVLVQAKRSYWARILKKPRGSVIVRVGRPLSAKGPSFGSVKLKLEPLLKLQEPSELMSKPPSLMVPHAFAFVPGYATRELRRVKIPFVLAILAPRTEASAPKTIPGTTALLATVTFMSSADALVS